MDAPSEAGVTLTAASVAAFLGELALLAALAVAGARLGDGVTSVVFAIAFPLALVVLWGGWLAPRSSRRLRHPYRLLAQLTLVLVAAVLLAASGRAWVAAVFFVIVAAAFTVAELQAARRDALR